MSSGIVLIRGMVLPIRSSPFSGTLPTKVRILTGWFTYQRHLFMVPNPSSFAGSHFTQSHRCSNGWQLGVLGHAKASLLPRGGQVRTTPSAAFVWARKKGPTLGFSHRVSSRYELHSRPQQTGLGRTIDMSSSGVSFTTESELPVDGKVTLHVAWPTRLERDRIVELHFDRNRHPRGRKKAALKFENVDFLPDQK